MKFVYTIFFTVIGLSISTCHVIGITQKPFENKTQSLILKESIEHEYSKTVREAESTVYLEDILFTLKNQNWSATEKPCLDQIYNLVYGLQNFTLWAVWDWDALSSEPQGILFGNRYQLGNFDQCMKAAWTKSHPHLKTKYCLAEVVLERTDNAVRRQVEKPLDPYQSALDFLQHHPAHTRALNELTWGACVPAACTPHTVEQLLGVVLARSHLGAAGMKSNISINEECQTDEDHRDHDELFYAFLIFTGSLSLICLICTYFNSRRNTLDTNTIRSRILESFCLKRNASDLLRMKKDGIEVFYGIRYLTMCLIVLDHAFGISNAGPVSDGVKADQDILSPVGLFVLHNDLFVDTFFLLSGFLTAIHLTKIKKVPVYLIILKRYVRLIVAYAVVIFFICAVYPYTGSGPLWNRAVAQDTDQCRKNWWLNLLMVSNYVDANNICLVVSWYIPCDFHFFVVTVLAYALYKQWPKLGQMVAAVLAIAAIILPGIITYMYQLAAVQLFTIEFVTNPRGMKDYQIAYIKSHTRYASYLVGFFGAWIYIKYGNNGTLNRIKQRWSILGTCTALIVMLVVMVFGGTFLLKNYSPLVGAFYAALNRPIWACGVLLLVYCCSFGHVPIVKSFLSWYPWVPLSRLTYGLYLVHTLMITRNVFSSRNPQHNDVFEILNTAAGIIVWGSLCALVLWLVVEAPANNLLTLCLQPKAHNLTSSNKKWTSTDESTSARASSSNQGHLHKNLPSVNYLSKM